jgi:hypothetical protein
MHNNFFDGTKSPDQQHLKDINGVYQFMKKNNYSIGKIGPGAPNEKISTQTTSYVKKGEEGKDFRNYEDPMKKTSIAFGRVQNAKLFDNANLKPSIAFG